MSQLFFSEFWSSVTVLDAKKFKLGNLHTNILGTLFAKINAIRPRAVQDIFSDSEWPVFEILQYDIEQHKQVLRMKSQEVEDEVLESDEFLLLLYMMLATVLSSEYIVGVPGIGLSGVQVGFPLKVFVAYIGKYDKWEFFVNPQIHFLGEEKNQSLEGCLSIQRGKREVPVPRYNRLKIKYISYDGEGVVRRKGIFKGFDARVIQHEYDHLQGKLILDYI